MAALIAAALLSSSLLAAAPAPSSASPAFPRGLALVGRMPLALRRRRRLAWSRANGFLAHLFLEIHVRPRTLKLRRLRGLARDGMRLLRFRI